MIQVDRDLCGVCGRCVAFCPREALSVTAKRGRLIIDDTKCTSCFGGSHSFNGITTPQKRQKLPPAGPPGWNLICTENCPVEALKATDDDTAIKPMRE